jgi:hypothetical protein
MMTRKLTALLVVATGLPVPVYAAGSLNPDHGAAKASRAAAPLAVARTTRSSAARSTGSSTTRLEAITIPKVSGVRRRTTPVSGWRSFPEQSRRSSGQWGSVLTDVARHLPAGGQYDDAYQRYTREGDLVTAGHEWTHFVNAHLCSLTGVGHSAFYVLGGRYFALPIPERLRGIVPHVPASLRGDLYDLYLVQNSSNARVDPLYLFDEWTAYANDVTIAVDQLTHGKPLNPFNLRAIQTMTAGNVLEFTFYGFAVGMAVKKYDPAYYGSLEGQRLREFIAYNARRSMAIYNQALRRPELSRGDIRHTSLMSAFRDSTDAAEIRAWVKSDLDEDLAGLFDVR